MNIVGGCCGSTPEHIKLVTQAHHTLLENVEHCGGESERADTGILCHC